MVRGFDQRQLEFPAGENSCHWSRCQTSRLEAGGIRNRVRPEASWRTLCHGYGVGFDPVAYVIRGSSRSTTPLVPWCSMRSFQERPKNKSSCAIESVWDVELPPHRPFLFSVPLVGDGAAGYRMLKRDDWGHAPGEGDLDWPPYLTTVDVRAHNSSERPNVVEVGAHEVGKCLRGKETDDTKGKETDA